jgi:hypothetical protein
MDFTSRHPATVFVVSLIAAWLSAYVGDYWRRRRAPTEPEENDLNVILGAALTLLGLIIGFSFSMATSRYDQRKTYEEAEANAIGTEYLRAGLMPAAEAARIRSLLKRYLDQRILFYTTADRSQLALLNTANTRLQDELWSAVRSPALAQPTALAALVAAGMNDVLNSQGYTQAAWWNRIPVAAWALMLLIGMCCNMLLGYSGLPRDGRRRELVVLPLIVAVAFFLIADLDSPRGGLIRVQPQNLLALSGSL